MVIDELGNGVEASPTGSVCRVEGLALPLMAKVVDRSAVFEDLSSTGLECVETLGAGTRRSRLRGQWEQGVDDVREGLAAVVAVDEEGVGTNFVIPLNIA